MRIKGIGVEKKRAQSLCEEDIERLWSSKVIGVDSPQALLNAVFLLNGKNFALRSSEHYSLKVSQLANYTIQMGTYTMKMAQRTALEDYKTSEFPTSLCQYMYALSSRSIATVLLGLTQVTP